MSLLRFCILILPPLVAVVVIVGSPTKIEQALKSSGIYNNFANAILDQSIPKNNDPQAKALLTDPGVREAVNQSFTPQVLQADTEQITNGTFDWLHSKTTKPDFSIDLSQPRLKLVTNLTVYAKKRADTLPLCTLAQVKQLSPDQNILDLTCRPPGLDTAKAAQQFSDDVMKNTDFLSKQKFTADSLSKDQSGQNVFEKQKQIPRYYHWLVISPWIIGGLSVLMGVVLILLHDKRRTGIASLSWTLIGSGVFWLLGVVAYNFMFQHLHQNIASIASVALRQSISTLISTLANDLIWAAGAVAIVYILIGLAGLVTLRLTKPKPGVGITELETTNTVSTEVKANAHQPANIADEQPTNEGKDRL